jgi:acetylornithine aminotransferase/acetylornithine/N-succinyldiaminopimelate aminotransferase
VWDSDGKEYLDFTGGIAVTALGHSHPKVVGTMREQAATLLHVSNLFYIPQQTQLAKLLCDHSFADRVFFSNSGAEANESAIKLARKWAKEHGASDRGDIITMRGGFHGRTLATVTATAQEKYHHGFEPLPGGFKYVPFNDLRAVERAIDSHTAAVMVEPIQGEGGVNIPDDGYLPGLRKLCDEAGVLLVLDEIQTGMGRTGRLWAYEHSGVEPDIMTLAKALANGVPIGATLATESVASAFTPGTHGSTFGGNPFATAVGLTVFTTLMEERLPERAAATGRLLRDQLEALRGRHPKVATAVRGRGLLVGMDLVPPVGDVIGVCRERGLLVLSAGDNTLRLAPPLIVDEASVRRAVEIIDQVLSGFVK